jgi:hypothetical protein
MKNETEVTKILEDETDLRNYWMGQIDLAVKTPKKLGQTEINPALGLAYDQMIKHDQAIAILTLILDKPKQYKEWTVSKQIKEDKKTRCSCEEAKFTRDIHSNGGKPICNTCGKAIR